MTATPIEIARICHEANRAYCAGHGDLSHDPWDTAVPSLQASVISGVEAIMRDPTLTPEQSHEGWLAYTQVEGWTFGTEKDVDKKTHPCFRPYHELPAEQRVKDHIFGAIVRACLGL